MATDRVLISPGYGAQGIERDELDFVLDELRDSPRFQTLLSAQRAKPECRGDEPCTQEYQFEKPISGGLIAEVLACRRCKQVVVNLSRRMAA